MKIGFITDTNILSKKTRADISKLSEEEGFLDYMNLFLDYIDDLKKTKQENELTYLMPEIILDELACQKIHAYNKSYESFKVKYNTMQYGLKGRLPQNNICKIVEEEKKKYANKVKTIKLKYQNKIYRELVKEALNKQPPFDKSEQKRKK